MNLNRLLVLAITIPTLGVVAVTAASYIPHAAGLLSHSEEHLILAAALIAGIVPFSLLMIGLFRRVQRHIVQQNELLSRRNQETEALLKVGRAVEESLDLDRVLPAALEAIVSATTAEAAEVWLPDRQGAELTLRYHEGAAKEAFTGISRFAMGEGLPGIAAATARQVMVHDLGADPRFQRRDVVAAGFSTYGALPLRSAGGRTVGVLGVAARDRTALTSMDELRLLELMTDHLTAAVENARLHEEVQTLAILTERERIAMEMHDGLAQVLGYVNTKAQAVKEFLRAGDIEGAIKHMDQLEASARETYDDVREGILALGANGRKRPLDESIREYAAKFSELAGLSVSLDFAGERPDLVPGEEVQLIRIVQEALANVRKHADAKSVRIDFEYRNGGWKLTVADDGKGFDPTRVVRDPWPHLGLQSMRERSSAIEASFTLDTAPGKGTRIVVEKRATSHA